MTAGTKKNLSDYFEIFIFKIPTNGVIFLHLVVAQSRGWFRGTSGGAVGEGNRKLFKESAS